MTEPQPEKIQPEMSAFQRMVPHSLDRLALTAGAVTCSLLLAAGSFLGGVIYGRAVEKQAQCYQQAMHSAELIGEDEVLKRSRSGVAYYLPFGKLVRKECE